MSLHRTLIVGTGGIAGAHAAAIAAHGGRAVVVAGVREARATLELIAAIYASAFTGRLVWAGDIGPGHPFYPRMDRTGAPWAVPPDPRRRTA